VPEPEILTGTRIVADPAALDSAVLPAGTHPVRIAPDDLFVVGPGDVLVDDPHAIVEPETMFSGIWLDLDDVSHWVTHNADWHLPDGDGLSQGMVAALPVKILADGRRALVIVPVSFAHELAERMTPGSRTTAREA
jgi:hypothetical protein